MKNLRFKSQITKKKRGFAPNVKTVDRFRQRLWWAKALLPVVLIFVIFFAFTIVIYTGQKHHRLAAYAESGLIEFSLSLEAKLRRFDNTDIQKIDPFKVVVVSAEESDFDQFNETNLTKIRDVSIEGYAKILEKVAQTKPATIVLSWNAAAHTRSDDYYRPLTEVISAIPKGTKIIMVYGLESHFLPPDIAKLVLTLDDDYCMEGVQTVCPYNEIWNNEWIVQVLFRDLVVLSPEKFPYIVTQNIPNSYPAYLLHLRPPEQIPTFSFSKIKNGQFDPKELSHKTIFIGSDIPQRALDREQSDLSRRTITIFDKIKPSQLRFAGTPYHLFWAQVAQMFYEGDFVAIPPIWVSVVITVLFCIFMLVSSRFFGGLVTLGVFTFFAFSTPFLNALFIKFLGCYFPLFECYFFGVVTLVVSSFVGLSSELLERWRIDERRQVAVQMADLKGNFISLLSHNLNTPIAKMQGMLNLLDTFCKEENLKKEFKDVRRLVTELELLVKSVLLTNSVEEGAVNNAPMMIATLRDEFSGLMNAILKNIGVQVDLTVSSKSTDDPSQEVPIKIDPKVVSVMIGVVLTLLTRQNKEICQTAAVIKFKVISIDEVVKSVQTFSHKDNRSVQAEQLKIEIFLDQIPELSLVYEDLLRKLRYAGYANGPIEENEEEVTFFEEVLLRYIRAVLKIYAGKISIEEPGKNQYILALYFVPKT